MIRIYDIPDNTFETDEEEDSSEEDSEEESDDDDESKVSSVTACIYSSAVFGENPRYCYSLGIVIISSTIMQKLFCNISVITEETWNMCSLSILSRETIQNAFFQNFAPFFDLDFLSSIKHPMAKRLQHMQCSCLTPFS